MTVLAVDGLTKSFGGVRAVKAVSFTVAAGELVALIGPNGAGKTTCFNILNGQLRPDAGRVRLVEEEITHLRPLQVWRRGVGRSRAWLLLPLPFSGRGCPAEQGG